MENKKKPRRQIFVVFVSMIGVMFVGMLLGMQRENVDRWVVFEPGESCESIFLDIEFYENEIHAILVNSGATEIGFGQEFVLTKLSGDTWRVFPFYSRYVNDIMYILPPGLRAGHIFILREDMFVTRFMPGTYRIVTTVWDEDETPIHAWGEFSLSPRD